MSAAAKRAHGPVHRAWRRGVRRRRLVRSGTALGAALAITLLVLHLPDRTAPEPLATIVESFGEVSSRTGELPGPIDLAPGGLLRTGPESGVRLRLIDGTDLRLDSGSTLEWLGQPGEGRLDRPSVRLSSGGLYFRSPPSEGRPLAITTPFGELINRGTEYELRVIDGDRLELAVHEGSVRFHPRAGDEFIVESGEQVLVGSEGTSRNTGAETAKPQWTLQLSRPFALDGRTIDDFVRWVADERGLEVRWMIEEDVRSTRLRGGLIWRDPADALGPTLRMAGLQARVEGRLLLIRANAEAQGR